MIVSKNQLKTWNPLMNSCRLKCTRLLILACTLLSACQHSPNTRQSNNANSVNQQQQASNAITLKQIFADKYYDSDKIKSIRWLKDGSGYTVVEEVALTLKPESKEEKDSANKTTASKANIIVRYHPETLARSVLVSSQQLTPRDQETPLTIDDYHWSDDQKQLLIYTNSKKVWRSKSRGDYWLLNLSNNQLTQVGNGELDASQLMFAKFSPNSRYLAYVYYNNLYLLDINAQTSKQLTTSGKDGIINGVFDWVYEEEFQIRDGFRWSPDSQQIAFWQLDTRGSKDFILINNTDSLYPKLTKFPYPKVGETNALAKVGILDIDSRKTRWADIPHNSREMYIPRMNWAGEQQQLLVQHVNRRQNTNKLYLVDSQSGKSTLILTETDKAYLDKFDDAKWLKSGHHFIWKSERSGWRHLYRVSRNGQNLIDLTPGNFDILALQAIDEVNGWLYFTASPENATQSYLYRSRLDGSIKNQRVTPEQYAGYNRYQISEDGQWAIHTHSAADQPTQKRLVKINQHQEKYLLLENKSLKQKFAALNLPKTEFFKVETRDGLSLDGYLIKPKDFNPNKKYPLIFFVYGEMAGQTVVDSWTGSRHLWNHFLAQQGYLVASIDNRGTRTPKGRDWRKSIYGAVGVLSSRDQSDALVEMRNRWSFIDKSRIGIWGHSGGGSMTLNMLFRYPDQYHVGISVAPVADQRLYDTIYQERYSDLLTTNPKSYEIGSPITYAENLKGKLLLIHGTGDDNVHYQGTEKLINKLIELNKPFSMMAYPNRGHGIRKGKNTLLHRYSLMYRYFSEHLEPGAN